MIVEKTLLDEYPFKGKFVTSEIDGSKPLDERSEVEKIVLETVCDIQELSKSDSSGIITDSFSVYFPFKKDEAIKVKRGMKFIGFSYGLEINGIVTSVAPSQLGGCTCIVKDLDV